MGTLSTTPTLIKQTKSNYSPRKYKRFTK